MNNFKIIMAYTIKEHIKKKSFIITNLITFAIIILMFNIPNIMEKMNLEGSKEVLVIDAENIYESSLEALNTMELGYDFKIENKQISQEEIKEKINSGEIIAVAELTKQEGQIFLNYTVKEIGQGTEPTMLQTILEKIYYNVELSKLNLTEQELLNLNTKVAYEVKTVDGDGEYQFSFGIIVVAIGLFYAIYFCAYQISAAVTMEKTSKVMETLVTSTSPKTIILGKTIGTGLVGLLQMLAIIIVSVVSYKIFTPQTGTLDFLDFSAVTPSSLVAAIVYFILGYALYAFLYALVGSTVSKPEDIPTANSPVAIISMLGFYLGYFAVLFTPNSTMARIATLVPISSPFGMPLRMMITNVPMWEIVASIAILLITIVAVIQISIKIYSKAVLHYGNPIKIKDMFKLYRQK